MCFVSYFLKEGCENREIAEDEEDEAPEISKCEAIIWLGILTVWISLLSDYLVDAIEVPIFLSITLFVFPLKSTFKIFFLIQD